MRVAKRSISIERITQLEAGCAETTNHLEQMALDQSALMANVFPPFAGAAVGLRAGGFISRLRHGGWILFEQLGSTASPTALSAISDVVRAWGAFSVPHVTQSELGRTIAELLPYADDPHFAVREWAWLSLRPLVVRHPTAALRALRPLWTSDSPHIRRFCSEVTRPRSVWGRHILEFKRHPDLAEEMLRLLAGDESRYVQDSIGNWLNDAAVYSPGWVLTLCGDLEATNSASPRTLRRATRRLATFTAGSALP